MGPTNSCSVDLEIPTLRFSCMNRSYKCRRGKGELSLLISL